MAVAVWLSAWGSCQEKGMEILDRSSPNYGPRRDGLKPKLVVLHHTAMTSAEGALARLCDPAAEVSSHYLIAEDGLVWRLVPEEARAWHAGAGSWDGGDDINSRSIGIELANAGPLDGFPPFPEPQMAALEGLLDAICARWGIPRSGVVAHSDIAPGRKADPGPKFDWSRLARCRRAVWAEARDGKPGDWKSFEAAAATMGYGPAEPEVLLAAVRLRFRPWVRGPLQAADVEVLRAVVDGLGAGV